MLETYVLRPVLLFILKLFYDLEIKGLEHFHAAGDKVVIICNHQSFLDPLIIAVAMPQKPAFAMNVFQAEKWYFRWLAHVVKIYKLDPSKPMSMKQLISDLRGKGGRVVIFPEGRITTSTGIMKIYEGASLIAEKTGARVLPVNIDGAQFSMVSNVKDKIRPRLFPKIRLTLFPSRPAEEMATNRALYDALVDGVFYSSPYRQSFLASLLNAQSLFGGKQVVASDITFATLTYRQLFTRAFILSDKLSQPLSGQHNVAVLLPNALGAAVTFVALHMLGKVPCMLNFSAGAGNVLHACRIACAKTVLTSRTFIEKGKLEHLVEALQAEHHIIYLEDIRPQVKLADKLRGLGKALAARYALSHVLAKTNPDEPAVILYTSGSEGTPKGVALSHANIMANIYQARAKLDLNPSDGLFNALPIFHSFGLTIGMLMPLACGIRTFLYPSPLHYRVIPDLVYDTNSTIMLGTDTFFNGYARYAHPYDFWRVRLAVAGAEKLKDSTRQLWQERFGVSIMQGYGVTEASPAISFNTPVENKHGTVGRIFPGMQAKLEPVPGLEQGGRLFVKGPNIMLGYLKADQPGVIQPQGEWYDTGDIVSIDEEGFITIQGRAKRFAKIGGEMVSLQAVEDLAQAIEPESAHAAVAVADPRKGEHIILYSESKALTRERILEAARAKGIAEIMLPKHVAPLETIPRLGNGKIDYPALGKLAADHTAA